MLPLLEHTHAKPRKVFQGISNIGAALFVVTLPVLVVHRVLAQEKLRANNHVFVGHLTEAAHLDHLTVAAIDRGLADSQVKVRCVDLDAAFEQGNHDLITHRLVHPLGQIFRRANRTSPLLFRCILLHRYHRPFCRLRDPAINATRQISHNR